MTANALPFVSVVIPVFNAEATIAQCLDSIRSLDYPPDRLEVIVVDNDSTDASVSAIRAKGFEPLRCERRGPAAARNVGIAAARGEIVAFTDSDVTVRPDWLRELVRLFDDAAVGGVGGRIEPYCAVTGSEMHAIVCGMLDQKRQLEGQPPYMLPFAATANAAYRRAVLEQIGGFDESLLIAEDADLAWRVQYAGHRLAYAPDAVVLHRHRSSRADYFRQTYRYGQSTVDLFRKHRDRLGKRTWISWNHYGRILGALWRAPIMPFLGKTGWEKVAPLYDICAFCAWTAGRVRQSIRRRIVVI